MASLEDAVSAALITPPIADLLGATACLAVALRVRLASPERLRAFLAHLSELAHPQPIELELARVLAWLRRQDPAELGYTSLSAFYAERVDWGASWRKALVRLVESDLDLVKRAVLERVLPLRVAVRAPGRVAVDEQAAWIAAGGEPPEADGASERRGTWAFDWHYGDEADAIRRARHEARACLGRAASAAEVDDYLIACHRDNTPPTQILARAHERPPPPEPPGPLSWGEGSEPTSVAEALERMDRLQDALRGRTAVLARAWVMVTDEALWTETDCLDAEEFANEHLGISLRQAQRLAKLGWTLVWYPELDAAIREGLSTRGAAAIGDVADERTMGRWIEVAGRVGRKELLRAVQDAREGSPRRTLASYEGAIEAADAWDAARATGAVATSAGPDAAGAGATSAGPAALDATSAGPATSRPNGAGRLRVALPHEEPVTKRGLVGAPAGVLAASRWWCDNVKIPKKYGFAAVKEREHYRCQNPECGRVSLRNEAHHVHYRSHGGDDSPGNAVTLCRPCHLRGVHGGRLRVEGVEVDGMAALLWTWPDGRRVLALRERPT